MFSQSSETLIGRCFNSLKVVYLVDSLTRWCTFPNFRQSARWTVAGRVSVKKADRCPLFGLRENAGRENAGMKIHDMKNSTVELSCVGVASASAVCIEFATSSRRLPMTIWKLNMLRIYPVELSRVELCRRCVRAYVGCRDPVYNSAANGVSLEVAGSPLATAASWLRSHCDTTQLDFVVGKLFRFVVVETHRDCRQLWVTNSIYTPPTQLNATVKLRRRRRCVLGLKLHSYKNDVANTNVVKINIYREKWNQLRRAQQEFDCFSAYCL